ncbi:MAG TPA: PEP-CTERM sorting domain-containing protein [Stellaceae bacterium]
MKQMLTKLALASAVTVALSAAAVAEPLDNVPPPLDFGSSGAFEELANPIEIFVPELPFGWDEGGSVLTMVDLPDPPISEAVPEPSTLPMLAVALAGFALLGAGATPRFWRRCAR